MPKPAKPKAPGKGAAKAAPPRPCGSVARNVGHPPANIKELVLKSIGQPTKPMPPDKLQISLLLPGDDDPITTLTGACMNYGQFHADGLWMDRLYALGNGKILGAFVNCINCCYSHGRS